MKSAFYAFHFEPAWYKFGQTRFGPIRLEVGARGGSHGHGVEVNMRTLTTDSQEASFPPQAHGSSVGPIQRGSTMVLFREAAGHMLQASFRTQFRELRAPPSSG